MFTFVVLYTDISREFKKFVVNQCECTNLTVPKTYLRFGIRSLLWKKFNAYPNMSVAITTTINKINNLRNELHCKDSKIFFLFLKIFIDISSSYN